MRTDTDVAAVIVHTVLAALHTAIVGVGYVLVERDRLQPWLLAVNLGAYAVPGLVYLLERWGNERKRKRKEISGFRDFYELLFRSQVYSQDCVEECQKK